MRDAHLGEIARQISLGGSRSVIEGADLQGRGRRFDPSSAYHLTQYVRRPSVFIEEVKDLHQHTQGLGMRRVLLIISEPESTKSKTSGCRSRGPRTTTPSGSSGPMRFSLASNASSSTSSVLVGIGVPSK